MVKHKFHKKLSPSVAYLYPARFLLFSGLSLHAITSQVGSRYLGANCVCP
jgi:hypothetical protein